MIGLVGARGPAAHDIPGPFRAEQLSRPATTMPHSTLQNRYPTDCLLLASPSNISLLHLHLPTLLAGSCLPECVGLLASHCAERSNMLMMCNLAAEWPNFFLHGSARGGLLSGATSRSRLDCGTLLPVRIRWYCREDFSGKLASQDVHPSHADIFR